jgi:hypothetical protein
MTAQNATPELTQPAPNGIYPSSPDVKPWASRCHASGLVVDRVDDASPSFIAERV